MQQLDIDMLPFSLQNMCATGACSRFHCFAPTQGVALLNSDEHGTYLCNEILNCCTPPVQPFWPLKGSARAKQLNGAWPEPGLEATKVQKVQPLVLAHKP
jgi:hypothetical protein